MVSTCSVLGCKSRGVRDSTVSFHRFPKREKSQQRFEAWVTFCRKKNFTPATNSYICSRHFLETDFDSSQLMKLRLLPGENLRSANLLPGAVPSVRCDIASSDSDAARGQKCGKKRNKSDTKTESPGDPDDPDEKPCVTEEVSNKSIELGDGIFCHDVSPSSKLFAKNGDSPIVSGCSIRTDIFRECDSSSNPEPEERHERSQKPYHQTEQIVKQDPDALDSVHLYAMQDDEFLEEPIIQQQPSVYCQSFISPSDDRIPSPAPIPSTGSGLGRSRKKRRAVISAAVEKLHQVTQSLEEFLEDEDDFDAFGTFVALSLKKLPLQQALEAQTEMQNTLTKFRLMHLTSTSGASSQSQSSDFPSHEYAEDQPPQPPVQFYITENSS